METFAGADSYKEMRVCARSGNAKVIERALTLSAPDHTVELMTSTSTSYRYIVQAAGVRGGKPTVEGTRIGVHDVIGLLQNGETIDTVPVRCFPQLTRAQVYECLAYYEDHPGRNRCPGREVTRVKFLLDHDVPHDPSTSIRPVFETPTGRTSGHESSGEAGLPSVIPEQ